jgi:hypothetical protein
MSVHIIKYTLYFHSARIQCHIARALRQAKESDVTPVNSGLAVMCGILGN